MLMAIDFGKKYPRQIGLAVNIQELVSLIPVLTLAA